MHTQTQQPLARRRGPGPGFHGPAPAWTECASLSVRMGGPDGPGQLVGSYISIIIHLRGSGEALDEGVALEAGPEREAAQDAVSRGQPQLLMYRPEKTPATCSRPWSARHPKGSRSSRLIKPSPSRPQARPRTMKRYAKVYKKVDRTQRSSLSAFFFRSRPQASTCPGPRPRHVMRRGGQRGAGLGPCRPMPTPLP